MNKHLEEILNLIQQGETLSAEQKTAVLKSLKDADKELEITTFKLDRTEKVKRTTAILLEETIEELEQKRKAVEAQNKELEIESSLERVRAVAMGMRKPDDLLDICEILYTELLVLGFSELRNAMINIYNDDQNYFLNYDYSVNAGKTVTVMPYNFHPLIEKQVSVTKKAKDAFFEFSFTGNELINFRELRKNNGEQDDPKLEDSSSLHYYFYSIGNGSIGISTYSAIIKENLELLKRFRNVFILSYQRYTDIRQAEAQAKESQIQLALERVRARTMAMQRSDELKEVSSLLFKQVDELGIKTWSTGFNIWDPDGLFLTDWMTSPAGGFLDPYEIPLNEFWLWKESTAAKQRGEEFLEIRLNGEKLKEGFTYLSNLPDAKDKSIFQSISLAGFQLPECVVNNYAFFSQGSLLFVTYEPVPEAHDIFKRFAKVFEQTYTRFLDLQKAEAQAREARIETALEKIRSRSLGMHHSNEIKDVVSILFEKLKELDLVFDGGAAIHLFTEGSRNAIIWVASADLPEPFCVNLPYDENSFENNPIITDVWNAKETGEHIYNKFYSFKEKNRYFDYVFKYNDLLTIPESLREFILQADSYTASFIAQKNSLLGATSWTRQLFSDYDFDVLKRIARVFEQAYIRFLDLQKAEAQTRESQIQLALERVRARTMAMQKSDELSETAVLLFHQLMSLGLDLRGCGFNIWEKDEKTCTAWMSGPEGTLSPPFNLPLTEDPFFARYYESRQNGEDFWVYETGKEELVARYKYLGTLPVLGELLAKEQNDGVERELPPFVVDHVVNFSNGNLIFITYKHHPDEWDIFKRFGKVFEQTYTRFLDLQKAEAQVREAEIENALEKVRSRSLAMHVSQDLHAVVTEVFGQLEQLRIAANSALIHEMIADRNALHFWIAANGVVYPDQMHLPVIENKFFSRFFEALENGEDSFGDSISKEEKDEVFIHYFKYRDVPPERQNFIFSQKEPCRFCVLLKNTALTVIRYDSIPYSTVEKEVIKRFGYVFEQSYTRFLDLQKAEAQAREAKIEVALERTRTQSMIMQHSKELDDTLRVFHEQVLLLGIRSAFSFLWLPDEKNDRHIFWAVWGEGKNGLTVFKSKAINYPLDRNEPATAQCLVDWKSKEPVVSYHVPPAGVKSYFAAWQELIDGVEQLKPEYFSGGLYYVEAFMKYGCFGVMVATDLPEDEKKILGRFAIEFERTYTRFLDLQKAEAQAKEAQIQLALERVRARTMAMQHSDELKNAAALLFQQIKSLGVPAYSCGYNIWEKDDNEFTSWMSTQDGSEINGVPNIPLTEDANFTRYVESKQKGEQFFVLELRDERMQEHYQYLKTIPAFKAYFDYAVSVGFDLPKTQIHHLANFSHGNLLFITLEPSLQFHNVFKRFAAVFEQTYTRFLDLQKAEAQARESQIEAALERVRSRSMGMQKSEELREVIQVIYDQLVQLSFNISNAGFLMDYRQSNDGNIWMADATTEFPTKQHIPDFEHPFKNDYLDQKDKGQELFTKVYPFEEKNTWWEAVLKYLPTVSEETKRTLLSLPALALSRVLLKNIGLYLLNFAGTPYSDQENATLIRFGKVFEQTYTRFNDLKKAEAQALEAIKRASVDRVRAEIASMRTTNDLEKITPLVWNELTTLGVPFIRCGVFIMDEEQQLVHTFLSTPEGKAIATLHVPFEFNLSIITNGVGHWRRKTMYQEYWDATAFTKAWTALSSLRETSNDSHQHEPPPEHLHLHLLPFVQGMLYVGNDTPLNDVELQLVQNLADAFSTAYARYEDFNKLESANIKIERTLVDLKQAQAQLVQSEKMASLGELTAGIAHEIQNPLNFVNNFSDVNTELMEELKGEWEKVNGEKVSGLAEELFTDIVENEKKINHHGKRADAIVKGMLQHSRSTGNVKEPTDINVLTDEYLRLAYHGLRAKDKSFNAALKTEYDETIGKINIIPQDIGRVILNMITNAFYAINEKKKIQDGSYEPTLSIITKKMSDTIEIRIADNGNGIPQKVVDKIFQPFFTTKPTGQGTGLGLSLAYDIVKAHGGEIKVETKDGEGAEFVIELQGK